MEQPPVRGTAERRLHRGATSGRLRPHSWMRRTDPVANYRQTSSGSLTTPAKPGGSPGPSGSGAPEDGLAFLGEGVETLEIVAAVVSLASQALDAFVHLCRDGLVVVEDTRSCSLITEMARGDFDVIVTARSKVNASSSATSTK